jgi:hypothetical protein
VDEQDSPNTQEIQYNGMNIFGGACSIQLAVSVKSQSARILENQILFFSLVSLATLLGLRLLKARSKHRVRTC